MELVSQLIDARFPDYRAIIPKTHTTRTVVDTAPSCSRPCVSPSSLRDNANIIRLAVVPGNGEKEGQVRLTASSQEMGDNVNELDALVEGTDLEIALTLAI